MRTRWLRWVGLWTLLGLVSSTQLYFADPPGSWSGALRATLPDWYLWGLLSLVVLRLARRFRVDRANFGRHFLIHLGASLNLALLHLVAATALQEALHLAAGGSYPFVPNLLHRFTTFFHWDVLVYWGILAVAHALDYHRDLEERHLHAARLEARLAEARLQALTLQLQPHFLFNTLNAVAELMHEDVVAADRMLNRLAELLRWTLESAERQEIPLQRELEIVDRYLAIEQARFQDRLRIRLDVAPDVRPALVPAMILLPLVENAVRHGLAAARGSGQVGIRARREGSAGTLALEVWDDGGGAVLATAQDRPAGRGIGLANTRARLQQLYGEAHRFELRDGEGGGPGGLLVRLSIPYREAAA